MPVIQIISVEYVVCLHAIQVNKSTITAPFKLLWFPDSTFATTSSFSPIEADTLPKPRDSNVGRSRFMILLVP